MSWPPTVEEIVDLPANELGLIILAHYGNRKSGKLHRNNISNAGEWNYHGAEYTQDKVLRGMGEACDWLHFNGYIAEEPGASNGWMYVTDKGRSLAEATNPRAHIAAHTLLPAALHSSIDRRVRSQFLLGEYENAVFTAFREIEIRVRKAGKFDKSTLGTDLMRKAFNPDNGTLTMPGLIKSEQQGIADLFAGSISYFKNPSSHRQVDYSNPMSAIKAVFFADQLLELLDDIVSEQKKQSST